MSSNLLFQFVPNACYIGVMHQNAYDFPEETPYSGGAFEVKLILNRNFPQEPPKGYFVTKIFHPNVSSQGEICVNTLKRDWQPSYGIQHILLVSDEAYFILDDISNL